jgi:FkbM family methyltransferase
MLRLWRLDLEKVDPVLLAVAREFVNPGDSVWDIGANCGIFAFAASQKSGRDGFVLAVEPDLFLASLLNRSSQAALPDSAPVFPLACAVAEEMQAVELSVASRGRASNSIGLGRSQMGGVRGSQPTVAVSLDWLATQYRPPNVIKIDVEGLELHVLRGGRQMLAAHRPIIVCEVGGDVRDEVSDLFRSLDYRMHDLENAREPIDQAAFNTLALPA